MNSRDMLTINQVEQEFGLKRSTLYRFVQKGSLTSFKKPGDRRTYFRRRDLERLTRFRPRKKKPGKTQQDTQQ